MPLSLVKRKRLRNRARCLKVAQRAVRIVLCNSKAHMLFSYTKVTTKSYSSIERERDESWMTWMMGIRLRHFHEHIKTAPTGIRLNLQFQIEDSNTVVRTKTDT
jgi:hypothetical protein